jgi:hypothetical protein
MTNNFNSKSLVNALDELLREIDDEIEYSIERNTPPLLRTYIDTLRNYRRVVELLGEASEKLITITDLHNGSNKRITDK